MGTTGGRWISPTERRASCGSTGTRSTTRWLDVTLLWGRGGTEASRSARVLLSGCGGGEELRLTRLESRRAWAEPTGSRLDLKGTPDLPWMSLVIGK